MNFRQVWNFIRIFEVGTKFKPFLELEKDLLLTPPHWAEIGNSVLAHGQGGLQQPGNHRSARPAQARPMIWPHGPVAQARPA
jgi:hypothetical protein